ncbi:hypothetical protein J1605_010377 [Eschrichtius robustus]|uniref:Uncharacterized protein n=1 Tax=Eschrichtius robustus TaxID=9764 RepID=A0AB34GU90_ESCRO|nr:hypothetical protein J1605_010377 [Eschrichtius robustus]
MTTVSRDGCPRIGRPSGSHVALRPQGLEQPLTLGTEVGLGARPLWWQDRGSREVGSRGQLCQGPQGRLSSGRRRGAGRSEPAPGCVARFCLWTEPVGRAAPALPAALRGSASGPSPWAVQRLPCTAGASYVAFITTVTFVWKVSAITVVSCLPLYVLKYLKRKLSPPSYSKLSS